MFRGLVTDDELVYAGSAPDGFLALRCRPDDLVAPDLGHLCRPLARPASNTVNETPFSRLDQLCVGIGDEVVRCHALHDAGGGNVESAVIGHWLQLRGRHCRVFGICLKHGVSNALAHLEAHSLCLGGHRRDLAAALLPTHEGKVTLVQTTAVVRVDEVDACELILYQNLAICNGWHRPGLFDLQSRCRASLVHDSSLRKSRR